MLVLKALHSSYGSCQTFASACALSLTQLLIVNDSIHPENLPLWPFFLNFLSDAGGSLAVEDVAAFRIELSHQTNQQGDVLSARSSHWDYHRTSALAYDRWLACRRSITG